MNACEATIYIHRCDVSRMSALENGKTTMQEYKQRYLYIFKMADKPEIVIGLHLEPIIVAHDRMNLKYVLL